MSKIITISRNDDLFPESFRAIGEDCPERIYAMGNLELLKREHMVAIIGSRKATRAGNRKAYELGLKYAKNGYVVVSGLALAVMPLHIEVVWPEIQAPLPSWPQGLTECIPTKTFHFRKKF